MVKAIEFENKHGFMLRGFLDLPENADTIVVFLHGFTGNKTEHAMHFRNFSRVLSKNGIASMRMDYHGNRERCFTCQARKEVTHRCFTLPGA